MAVRKNEMERSYSLLCLNQSALDTFCYVDVGPAEPDFTELSLRTSPEKCEETNARHTSACNTSWDTVVSGENEGTER